MRVFATRDHKDHKEILSAIRAVENFAGRRYEQKALQQRFLLVIRRPTRLWPCAAQQHSFSSAICVYSRSSAVKKQGLVFGR
jgi:hypothetical protein